MTRQFHLKRWFLFFASLLGSQFIVAQSEATAEYRVSFSGNWTLDSTPGGVVSGAHFTTIAGGKHNASVSFWSPGERATSGLEGLAELGSTGGFLSEINASSNADASFTSGVSGGGTGTSSFTLNVKKTHPLITLATMIGPSPDWFVGLHGYSLLDSNNNWVSSVSVNLYPYDAGTEDGTEFSLANASTSPQGVITSLRGVGKFSNQPIATLSFTRQNTPPPQTPPRITSIERPSAANQLTNADSVTWLVSFSEAVQNVSSGDFIVNNTTATVTSVTLNSGSSNQYEVVVGGGNLANLNATISLGLSSQQNISNSSNVGLSSTLPTTNETYTIDNLAPTVVSISPTTTDESPFTATISFDEALVSGTLDDESDVVADNANVSTPVGSGSTYRVNITPNNPNRPSTITLSIPAGAGTDLAGNFSNAHEARIAYTPDAENTPAFVNSVAAITSDGLYHTGDPIHIGIAFSKSVSVSGTPTLTLQFDQGTKIATHSSLFDSRTPVFSYTLDDGDATSRLDYVSTQSLDLAGGSITDEDGLAADLDLPTPRTSGSLSATSVIRTSGRQNALPTFEGVDISNQVLMMNRRIDPISLPRASGGDEPITYKLNPTLPPGLRFNEDSLEVSGTPTDLFELTTYTWTATDVDGDQASLIFSINVIPRLPLQFPPSTTIQDQVFLQNDMLEAVDLPAARGGEGSHMYSLSPNLPEGLQINLDLRQISGTPTESLSQTTYTWSVSDEGGDTAAITFDITVLEDLQPVFESESIDKTFVQNSPITPFTLPTAAGGNGQLVYKLDSDLPQGLVLDTDTLEVSGTPTTPSSRSELSWLAHDQDGDSTSFRFHITVIEDVAPSFEIDTSISDLELISDSMIEPIQLPTAMNGNGMLSYALSPNLPVGLQLDMSTLQISGTPTSALPMTRFTWRVSDEDGDTNSISFNLTVLLDTQPSFVSQIANRTLVVGTPIATMTLPEASGGNRDLSYELMPELPDGLDFDADSQSISGTPTVETAMTTYTWTVTDIDGDSASISFSIVVHPAQPEVVGRLSNIDLFVGGQPQTIDASSVISGSVNAWDFSVSDSSVVAVSLSSPGVFALTPQLEGQTNIMVTASNVSGSVSINFTVSVVTDSLENDQIDLALSLQSGAILSSSMSVFKNRSNSHSRASDHHQFNSFEIKGDTSSFKSSDPVFGKYSVDHSGTNQLSEYSAANRTSPLSFGAYTIPLNFSHQSAQWRLWGAADRQSFSSGEPDNEIDGSVSNLYLGADLAISEHVFTGLAVATHDATSTFEFASENARGAAEIGTSLSAFYPYVQGGNGDRFSIYLLGGFGQGDSQIDREHSSGTTQEIDSDLSLFATGFDYVVLRRSNVDFSVLGDTGVATMTTQLGSGVLEGRESSSSKSSIGGSMSFRPQIESGSLTTSVDVRLATGAEGDQSGSGIELGANLDYQGDKIDLMLDGRTSTKSLNDDVQRSSLSARLRYKANSDATGLTLSLSPRWQINSHSDSSSELVAFNRYQSTQIVPFLSNSQHTIEGEIAYGFLKHNESRLLQPRLALRRHSADNMALQLGTRWSFKSTTKRRNLMTLDVIRNTISGRSLSYGLVSRIEIGF